MPTGMRPTPKQKKNIPQPALNWTKFLLPEPTLAQGFPSAHVCAQGPSALSSEFLCSTLPCYCSIHTQHWPGNYDLSSPSTTHYCFAHFLLFGRTQLGTEAPAGGRALGTLVYPSHRNQPVSDGWRLLAMQRRQVDQLRFIRFVLWAEGVAFSNKPVQYDQGQLQWRSHI